MPERRQHLLLLLLLPPSTMSCSNGAGMPNNEKWYETRRDDRMLERRNSRIEADMQEKVFGPQVSADATRRATGEKARMAWSTPDETPRGVVISGIFAKCRVSCPPKSEKSSDNRHTHQKACKNARGFGDRLSLFVSTGRHLTSNNDEACATSTGPGGQEPTVAA
ncbi:hypothetical protein QBC44DRAFT_306421 [Cladorrhinum sp. PSN332]|nr:hypothetical protein QBC44DRAFT_306421 [Cladorrhinum sp. PSN332]